jgi:Rrf2 family protein
MRLQTKTEYGLGCLIFMAQQSGAGPVTTRDIVRGVNYSQPFTEKIMQRLKAAGIVVSLQGSRGGYVLAKAPSAITLKDIVEALEGQTFEVFCQRGKHRTIICPHPALCDLSSIWFETKDLLDRFYGSITLEAVARKKTNKEHLSAGMAEV